MDKDELRAWLRLSMTNGVGSDAARRLLACFGSPQAVFEQTEVHCAKSPHPNKHKRCWPSPTNWPCNACAPTSG